MPRDSNIPRATANTLSPPIEQQSADGNQALIASAPAATINTHANAAIITDDKARAADARRSTPNKLFGRVWYVWSLFAAAMLLAGIGWFSLPLCYLLNRREALYPFALFGGRSWLRLSGARIVVKGRENINASQEYIYAANHRSYLDTATLFCHLPQRIGLFAKKELLKVPFLGWGMGYVNIMAIDRTSFESAARTVKAATDKIKTGRSFGVFVEGRRAGRGELLPFKKGAFYMAIETGTPIVPVAIKNTDVLMGKGAGAAYPGTIEMVLLPPIETKGLSGEEGVTQLIKLTRARIAEELKTVK